MNTNRVFENRKKMMILEMEKAATAYFTDDSDGYPSPPCAGFPDFASMVNRGLDELQRDLFGESEESEEVVFSITENEGRVIAQALDDSLWRYEGMGAKLLIEKGICHDLAAAHDIADRIKELFPDLAEEEEQTSKVSKEGESQPELF